MKQSQTSDALASDASDAELIAAVRGGDTAAYGYLFDRHRDAAARMARQLATGPEADDLVAEGFIRVLTTLQNGRGPDEFFRAYLLTSIRRLHVDRIRANQRVKITSDDHDLDRAVPFVDPAEMRFDQSTAAAAFSSLPERWRLVLWHLDVEGNKPADIAPLLGMSANSVSALAYRAREGLRQAYLQNHLAPSLHAACATTTGLLGGYVRKGLSQRNVIVVETHLDQCSRCTGLHLELVDVNNNLSGLIGPAVLGSVFAGYMAATAGGLAGLPLFASHAAKLILEPVRSAGSLVTGSGAPGVVTAAVVTTVAAAGGIAVATDFNAPTTTSAPVIIAAPAAKTMPNISAAPAKVANATPTPSLVPSPTVAPSAAPQPPTSSGSAPDPASPSTDPTNPPSATPGTPATEPTPTSGPSPAPTATTPPPILATDYGVTSPSITADDTWLQRRFTVSITAANDGRAAEQRVKVTMQFSQSVQFRGVVSAGWDCDGATRNQHLTTLACSSDLAAGAGTTFIVKVKGIRPAGSISIAATDDPRPENNSTSFRSPVYQFPS